jgi:phospholipid transport system substrate-binding protein
MTTRCVEFQSGALLRAIVMLFLGMVGLVNASGSIAAADDAATQYVQRMTRDLIAANKAGDVRAFSETLNRHANVGAIGNYALGAYQSKLRPEDKSGYYVGMVRFISRYAATESQKYQVSHVQITGPSRRVAAGTVVDTKVHLRDGQAYDVQWLLQPVGGSFKVRDAKVQVLLGDYWMTPFLKDLFEKYIADNGSVAALVMALNR